MLGNSVLFFLLLFATIVQTSLLRHFQMLQGVMDLVLLIIISWTYRHDEKYAYVFGIIAGILLGFYSYFPWWFLAIGYVLVILLIKYIQSYIWQIPGLILIVVTIIGSVGLQFSQWIYLLIFYTPINFRDTLSLVILPSIILNLIGILPVSALVGEILAMLYFDEEAQL